MSLWGDRHCIPDTAGSAPRAPASLRPWGNAENCEAATGIRNDRAHVETHPEEPSGGGGKFGRSLGAKPSRKTGRDEGSPCRIDWTGACVQEAGWRAGDFQDTI
ncbi:hypothetical protein Bbelb_233570 [Branchiostoma belcheri]|nr:hypothetical protein Bbelb_233570 [Branchiostoma belcheri]